MRAARQLTDFLDFLRRRFPAAQVETEGYGVPGTNAWVNIRLNGLLFVVQWRSGQGFGIWKPSVDALSTYGEGPDEHFRTYPAARRQIEQLLADAGAGGEGPAPHVAKRAAGG